MNFFYYFNSFRFKDLSDLQFSFGMPDYDIFNSMGDGETNGGDPDENKMSHVSLLEQLDANQTSSTSNSAEDSTAEMNNMSSGGGSKSSSSSSSSSSKNANGYQFSASASSSPIGGPNMNNNYYELILHKIVQYNVRKFPDEIITRNVILKGIFI